MKFIVETGLWQHYDRLGIRFLRNYSCPAEVPLAVSTTVFLTITVGVQLEASIGRYQKMAESQTKAKQGWKYDSLRHSLARKGVKTVNIENPRLKKAKEFSESGDLDWDIFKELFPDNPEERLQQMVNDGEATIDAEEADASMRKRLSEARITVGSDDEAKQYTLTDETKITLV
jgi:hypothetical protein